MAMTKVQAALLSNDMLLAASSIPSSKTPQILQFLPFMEVTGTSVRYTREATMPAATFYAAGGTWTENTPTFTNHTAELKILGGDADVDNFLQETYADSNDIEAEVIANRAKAIAHKFSETFITGTVGGDPNGFDGIRDPDPGGPDDQRRHQRCRPHPGDAGRADRQDQARQAGPVAARRRTRRQLKAQRRTSGYIVETHIDQFGQQVETYDGIPLITDDFMPDNETLGLRHRPQHLRPEIRDLDRPDGPRAWRHHDPGGRRARDQGRHPPPDQVVLRPRPHVRARRRPPSAASPPITGRPLIAAGSPRGCRHGPGTRPTAQRQPAVTPRKWTSGTATAWPNTPPVARSLAADRWIGRPQTRRNPAAPSTTPPPSSARSPATSWWPGHLHRSRLWVRTPPRAELAEEALRQCSRIAGTRPTSISPWRSKPPRSATPRSRSPGTCSTASAPRGVDRPRIS